jgi:hypothetical protein
MGWEKNDRPDYERINRWMLKYSYLGKQLIKYAPDELSKLVTQVEQFAEKEISTE